MSQTSSDPAGKSLLPVYFLILLFGAPPLLGWLYISNPDLLPTNKKNNGDLITPVLHMPGLSLENEHAGPFDWQPLMNKWTLMVVGETQCNGSCVERIQLIEQLRRAQKAGSQRIQLMLLMLDASTNYNGSSAIHVARTSVNRLHQSGPGLIPLISGHQAIIYIIDPRGNLMMQHNIEELQPREVLADLKVLLAATENWETQ